jgi:hypothetical protein
MALYVNGKKVAGIGLPGKSAYQYAVDGDMRGRRKNFRKYSPMQTESRRPIV